MAQKNISHERILQLLDDPAFHVHMGENPTDYIAEIDAINEYLRATLPQLPAEVAALEPQQTRIVGTRRKRVADPARLTGNAVYTGDVHLPGLLLGAILRCPHAHARITSIDTSAAEALPGVKAVVTYKNVPQVKIGGPPNQFALNQETHFAGEEVAAVAAEDVHIAREAIGLIKVTYEVLPAIIDLEESLKPDAPALVEEGKSNRAEHSSDPVKRGDFDRAIATAAITHEGTFSTPTLQHATMEPRIAVARWDGPESLTVWASSQYILGVRRELADFFSLPRSKVRVIGEFMGGGFGDKSSGGRQARLAAIMAQIAQHPVKVEYDRPGNFKAANHRYAMLMRIKAGVTRDGTLVALRADNIGDSGAYDAGSSSLVPLQRVYKVDNAIFNQDSAITNHGPSGPMRCVGDPQGTFAQEVFMDELAEKAGLNPLDFRLKNIETKMDQDRKLPWASCGLLDCLQKGADAIGWKQKWHPPRGSVNGNKAHGIGLAAHACSHGSMTMPMTAMMKLDQDGSLDVIVPSTEIGGGQTDAMMMIAAETVGVRIDDTHPSWGDTNFTPDSSSSTGSRQTISAGSAIKNAGLDLKRQLLEQATKPLAPKNEPLLPGTIDDVDTADGYVFLKADPSKRVEILKVVASTGNPMMGRGSHTIPPGYSMSTFSAGFAEVEVDLDTGGFTILRYIGANDVGRAINPFGVEQQMNGAISMGMGMAIGEAMTFDPSQKFPVVWNWENYAMPTSLDHPPFADFQTVIVEPGDAIGPYGAKGVGEPPVSPVSPAVANAIYNAVGVRLHDTPFTRDRLLAGLRALTGKS